MRKMLTQAGLALGGITLIAGTGLVMAPAAQAEGASAAQTKGVQAQFEGRTIDLSKDWGAAKACMVWKAAGGVQCFRTAKEQEQTAAKLAQRQTPSVAAASCSTPLRLYEHGQFAGRELSFYDRGYWQNLTDARYNFNDQTSSYRVGSCNAHLAEHTNGSGYWYPGNTNAWHSEGTMSSGASGWNDRISSIYNT
ncbi:hypothetical protein [Streptomyces sp. NBC_00576]|uniref:hypothetical protein n=1 Tax=Streptomyces sp. NBC_00576 TaxID=2903665 RepID=UPI002E7FF3DE|nr:hypothetical protein [Streptomyces sp. NBC_00576]WUB74085.1 beta/gamma crystallin family protein [Streptomyces sp. NBC_00576]